MLPRYLHNSLTYFNGFKNAVYKLHLCSLHVLNTAAICFPFINSNACTAVSVGRSNPRNCPRRVGLNALYNARGSAPELQSPDNPDNSFSSFRWPKLSDESTAASWPDYSTDSRLHKYGRILYYNTLVRTGRGEAQRPSIARAEAARGARRCRTQRPYIACAASRN